MRPWRAWASRSKPIRRSRASKRVTTVLCRRWLRADGPFPPTSWFLGIGVQPATSLAKQAGLPIGEHGGLRVDDRMQVEDTTRSGLPATASRASTGWLARWCTSRWERTPTSRAALLGTNLAGGDAVFPGVVRTAISKVCDLEVARTGMREKDARRAGLDFVTATIESTTRAGYFPGAQPMTVKVLAEKPMAGCSAHRSSAGRARPNGSMSSPWPCGLSRLLASFLRSTCRMRRRSHRSGTRFSSPPEGGRHAVTASAAR